MERIDADQVREYGRKLADLVQRGSGEDREIRRAVLYVLTQNAWKVGDSGRLAD